MDQLSYSYQAGTNLLLRVSDAYGSAGVGDLPHQVDAINYEYDPIGNLVKDRSEGIDQISWTVYGKIWEIQKQGAGSAIKYRYDASGNRVYKEGADGTKTFYVRDATGNTMAIYEKTGTGSLVLKEQELYGSSRLGTYQRNVEVENLGEQLMMGEGSYIWGSRFFELSNHLGNVLATIQDRMTVTNASGVDYFDPVVVSAQDYYAFGMMMPGRTYSAPGGGYRYGFNTQEKVDEIASGHYTAMYWEYDSRLGRRWNVDPVKKPWQSDYSCFSNSPIWKVDPNGDDDFFNADGTFSHSTKTGTKIYVQTASGNVAYSQLPMNSMHNRQTLANITAYYAGQVGISGTVGVSNYPKNRNSKALAFTKGNEIYVNARADGVGVTPLFDDYNNLKSALRHEKDHKDKGQGFTETSNFEHAEVYLTQIKDPTFSKTTADFKKGMAGSIASYLKDAAYDEMRNGNGDFTALTNLVSEFNKQSKTTGYTFSLVQTQSGYSNPEGYQYEVYVTPVKSEKKK